MSRRLLLSLLAACCCFAWTSDPEDAESDGTTAGEDTSTADCIDACKREDHPGCVQGCTATRWPSCAFAPAR